MALCGLPGVAAVTAPRLVPLPTVPCRRPKFIRSKPPRQYADDGGWSRTEQRNLKWLAVPQRTVMNGLPALSRLEHGFDPRWGRYIFKGLVPRGAAVRRLSEDNGIGVLYSRLPTNGCPKGKNRPLAGVGGPKGPPKPAKAPKPQSDRQ